MSRPTVFVVDDDPAVRDSLTLLLEGESMAVEAFASAEAFLAVCRTAPQCCAIVDIRMPAMDGLQLQAELLQRDIRLPLIFLTGHGDIPMSVRAIKAGAVDFLVKPITAADLIKSVEAAVLESEKISARVEESQSTADRMRNLTEREREVMTLAVEGLANKEIARRLGISHRTVEIHKARVMHKMDASSLIELARMLKAYELTAT
ncbi:MAG: response regulator transcription factor [Dechloromonas sp.]|uniref:response regulator transcription factor n=1 Tax=Dechloromonas sp. TaxID=1917218 RepID=UPI0027FF900C|nr:response regulator [Dechloromonas sp.]MBT9521771.1 response regulator transcription factor [Dechloromonas sp.]